MTPLAETARRFDLMLDEGGRWIVLRYHGQAIVLDDDGLAWTAKRADRRRAYRDVRAVRLQRVPAGRDAPGLCRIDFADGLVLSIFSVDRLGLADAGRAAAYRDFVATLHGHLRHLGGHTIAFRGGVSPRRQHLVRVVVGVAMVLFVGLPLGLLAWTGDLAALGLAIGGLALTAPLAFVAARNRPIVYTPDQVPAHLLP